VPSGYNIHLMMLTLVKYSCVIGIKLQYSCISYSIVVLCGVKGIHTCSWSWPDDAATEATQFRLIFAVWVNIRRVAERRWFIWWRLSQVDACIFSSVSYFYGGVLSEVAAEKNSLEVSGPGGWEW